MSPENINSFLVIEGMDALGPYIKLTARIEKMISEEKYAFAAFMNIEVVLNSPQSGKTTWNPSANNELDTLHTGVRHHL